MIKNIVFISLIFLTGCTLISEPETAVNYNPDRVLDETINLIKIRYPFIAFKNLIPDSLHKFYSNKISSYTGDNIFRLMNDLLYELKDGHVYFFTPSGMLIKPYTPRRSIKDAYSFSLKLAEEYLDRNFHIIEDGRIVYGTIGKTVGYIYIETFLRDGDTWYKTFSDVIKELANTNGIIIDVRANEGGSDVVSYFILSHFINSPFLSPVWLDAAGSEISRTYINPNQNNYANPVVLLQNGTCFSATEGFICMMRELANVITLGDTTGGGSGAPQDFGISYNIKIHLSTKAQLTYQRKHIEMNGIEPDVLVPQSRNNIENKRDLQLEAAVGMLKKQ